MRDEALEGRPQLAVAGAPVLEREPERRGGRAGALQQVGVVGLGEVDEPL